MTSCILITGGCGGLGLLVAEHLARKGPVNLVLIGVSAFDASKEQHLAFLRRLLSHHKNMLPYNQNQRFLMAK